MSELKHPHYQMFLNYLDMTLSSEKEKEFRTHLDMCEACSLKVKEFSMVNHFFEEDDLDMRIPESITNDILEKSHIKLNKKRSESKREKIKFKLDIKFDFDMLIPAGLSVSVASVFIILFVNNTNLTLRGDIPNLKSSDRVEIIEFDPLIDSQESNLNKYENLIEGEGL